MSREKLIRKPDGMLIYCYRAGGCMDFQFTLLSEVGAPYQAWFRREIARRRYLVTTRDCAAPYHIADFAENVK